jgi:hypothetical protein
VLDLETLASTRPLWTRPEGYVGGAWPTSPPMGRRHLRGFYKDLSDRFQVDLGHGYIGFNEIWEAQAALDDLEDAH